MAGGDRDRSDGAKGHGGTVVRRRRAEPASAGAPGAGDAAKPGASTEGPGSQGSGGAPGARGAVGAGGGGGNAGAGALSAPLAEHLRGGAGWEGDVVERGSRDVGGDTVHGGSARVGSGAGAGANASSGARGTGGAGTGASGGSSGASGAGSARGLSGAGGSGGSGGAGESFAALFEAGPRVAAARVHMYVGAELDVTVVQIGKDAVFVGLDEKSEGFIEAADLLSEEGELTVKVGSRVRARVVELEGRPGAVRLTPVFIAPQRSEAPEESGGPPAASAPKNALAVGAAVRGTVAGVERFGVFLQLAGAQSTSTGAGRGRGVRGLIPAAELGVPRGADLHKAFPLGTELAAKVIAIDELGRIRLSVTALAADEERRSFEEEKAKLRPSDGRDRSFGTLGDLLAKRRK